MASSSSSAQPASSGSGGALGTMNVIGSAVDAAATIAQTVASITDANKRRLIEANLGRLTAKEQQELAKSIARSNNKNEQATILINTILAARNAAADRETRSQTIKWILIGTAGITTLGILAWYLKK
jgi:hypothetical protein